MDNTMKRQVLDVTVWLVSLTMTLILFAHQAVADNKILPVNNDRYKAECGSCHIAYPPQLLPAPAWRRIMSGLNTHFGTDANVDARTAAEINAYLGSNAGTDRRAASPTDTLRITESAWFRREHREVPIAAWKHTAVKSAANCTACHTAAEQGDFRERNIRIPR